MPRKSRFLKPTDAQEVRVFRVAKYPTVAIPTHMAKYLNIIEGQSVLEVKVEERKLVYSIKALPGPFENLQVQNT